MAVAAQTKAESAAKTLIGWQGIRFMLPPEWNVTGFSLERGGGSLKVDSPGTMFVQIKWNDRRIQRPTSLYGWARLLLNRIRKRAQAEPDPPDLKRALESFLKQTGKQARKSSGAFDYKIKPETRENQGERVAHHFTWSGGGIGQGKIWLCKACRRVVIAQVVGKGRDPIADTAAAMFSTLTDHSDDGWNTWALYDLVAAVPQDFLLKNQKLMSGYLRLEFDRRGERLLIERWGLANVTRKKFTLSEWFRQAGSFQVFTYSGIRVFGRSGARADPVAEESEAVVHDHKAVRVTGRIRGPLQFARAIRDSGLSLRPATLYDGCMWECEETNKIYAAQAWYNKRSEGLLQEVVSRCECH